MNCFFYVRMEGNNNVRLEGNGSLSSLEGIFLLLSFSRQFSFLLQSSSDEKRRTEDTRSAITAMEASTAFSP